MKKRNVILLIAALCVSLLIGCGGDSKEKSAQPTEALQTEAPTPVSLVGSWKYQGELECIYRFEADGTGTYHYCGTDMPFTYTDDGTAVSLLYTGNTAPTVLPYTIQGQTLAIEDSFGTVVYYDWVS